MVCVSTRTSLIELEHTAGITSFTVQFHWLPNSHSLYIHRLVGLVVKASASRAEDPGSNPACAGIFPGSNHTSDLQIGTPVATLPGAWRYTVSAGTGRPGVSIL